jgi:DNA-binding SARP family transcriptional activator/tetratricopeptide (TPR) repeat protein
MQVRLLGPVDVTVDGVSRPVRGLRRKAVLAVLALHAGEIVSTDRLADVVWDEAAPLTVVNTLQHHVSYLRQMLGSKAAILARPPGYVLDLGNLDPGSEATDVQVAERLIRQGAQAAGPTDSARHLQAALALWRGRPLVDVGGVPWLEEQARRLDQLWHRASRALFDARLELGEHAQLVPDLEHLTLGHPFDEQVHGQLMLALYRSGRQADALAAFRRLRRALGDELGIDPSEPVRDLHAAILRQDPSLVPPAPAATLLMTPAAATPAAATPAQLPSAVHAFTGRSSELARLDSILPATAAATGPPAAVVISAVSGTAGVGKTSLAVHWAHRTAARFPDGQLYVNLRGFDPAGQPLDPAEAIRGFLDAFGVPAEQIPAGLPAQTGLYRSLLAGKRVLVVLDNARDAAQARPLLPGSPGCLALVTSRSQLTPLVTTEGARHLTLDLLTPAEARDLLTRRLGNDRVTAEPDAVDDIITRCARLPLALAIAAARAATHPAFPLTALAAELRQATGTLNTLDGGDPATDIRAVLSCSYTTLSTGAARLFRLLGLHPGPDISAAAAASLAGVPAGQARTLLTELTRAYLLTERASGRYAFHDLLRAYAAEQAGTRDSSRARRAAVYRVLDHYLHTARAAALLLDPGLDPVTMTPPVPRVTLAEPATARDALSWFTTERAALLDAIHLAAETGLGTCAWQLAWTLTTFFLRRGYWQDQTAAQSAALDAARRTGDLAGQAHALRGLALGYARSGRFREAHPHFRHALQLFEKIGDHTSQAHVHSGLTWLSERQDRPVDALSHALRTLDLFLAAGNLPGQVMAHNDIGWSHALLGNYQQALAYCQRALVMYQELGDRNGKAATWDSLGYIHRQLANYQQAITCYQNAIDLYRDLADRYNEADTLANLGDTHLSAGHPDAARRAWRHALDILSQLGHPDADRLRAKLRPREDPPIHASRLQTATIPHD